MCIPILQHSTLIVNQSRQTGRPKIQREKAKKQRNKETKALRLQYCKFFKNWRDTLKNEDLIET